MQTYRNQPNLSVPGILVYLPPWGHLGRQAVEEVNKIIVIVIVIVIVIGCTIATAGLRFMTAQVLELFLIHLYNVILSYFVEI